MITHLVVGLIINISLYKVSNFAEPFTRSKTIIEVELDLSNHAKIFINLILKEPPGESSSKLNFSFFQHHKKLITRMRKRGGKIKTFSHTLMRILLKPKKSNRC